MEKETICEVGCLLSSVSMALNHYQIQVDNHEVDPGTLNTWLRENKGYFSDDGMIEKTLDKLSGVFYTGIKISECPIED